MKMKIFLEINLRLTGRLAAITLWSTLFIGVLCTQATDIKVLIAFSSVAHMALVVLMIAAQLEFRTRCSYLVLISHGLSSSAAFFFRFLIYQRSQSRRILLNKGGRATISTGLAF